MAALDLLAEVAGDTPLLLLAEDAHWLDQPTAEVLAFVARRLESDPIVLLAASRDGYPSPLADAGLPEHRLGALDSDAAAELLDTSAKQLTVAERTRILDEAAGNPLALIELPLAAGTSEPGTLPLTERLERAFAARVGELPEQTRLLLWLAVSRAWWTDPGPAARRILVDATRRLGGVDHPDPRVFACYACADPVAHAAEALPRLQDLAATRTLDTESKRHLGPAALTLGAFDVAAELLASAADGARTEGRLGQLPRMLVLHGIVAAFLGNWDDAVAAGEEARRLATEFGAPLWIAGGETVLSIVAGMRGDAAEAERGAARAEQLGLAAGGKVTVALAQFGRVLSALGESRHEDAYATAGRLFDPADPAYHPIVARWLIADLAEAAVHTDHVAEASELLSRVAETAGAQLAVWIGLNLRHARAFLAAEPKYFDDALAAGLGRWPFQRARLQLAYGEWLRRQRRIADSRAPLRTARDTFDSLGCISWSPHLAAAGLSNREIGQRLFLSHRTISTHLYRIFPRLGITARGELQAALAGPSPDLK
jgi:Bacterial regulatory proteins, luxR family